MLSDSSIWGVTSYFNYFGSTHLLKNYRHFAHCLEIPLLTVEFAPREDFDLSNEDAEVLIRVSKGDIMFQKERLLNLGVRALPDQCECVVLLDADVIFGNRNWYRQVADHLAHAEIVQPFSTGVRLPPHSRPLPEFEANADSWRSPSMAYNFVERGQADGWEGGAIAVRRSLLDSLSLYDACIMGGGTGALIRTSTGQEDRFVNENAMTPSFAEHYREWALQLNEALTGRVGYVEGQIGILWHGDIKNRKYGERNRIMQSFGFNPYSDIKTDNGSAWCWNSRKSEMHKYVKKYFLERAKS